MHNTTGSNNVAAGIDALLNSTGSANVAIGRNAGKNLTTGSDNIDIANVGVAGESGTIRIGNNNNQSATFIAGISGTNVGGTPQPVVVKSNGQLGTAPALSASTASLAATVERLQRQVERLRERVKGGLIRRPEAELSPARRGLGARAGRALANEFPPALPRRHGL